MLGDWITHAATYGEAANGLMVRRQRTELVDTIERSKVIYSKLGWRFKEQDKLWRSPNGARLRFAYLENDSDAEAYQGHSYSRVYPEEIGNFPRAEPVLKLMATLRSAYGVPVGLRGTGNPGGPGHQWVKNRYIDPAPGGYQPLWSEFKNPFTGAVVKRDRIFIPSRLDDNPRLGDDYVANLSMVGSPALVRAWLEGDWSVVAGAFFPEFAHIRHVVTPFEIPRHWTRIRSCDWGTAKPFCVLWWAVSDGEIPMIPKGALVAYREWYGVAKTNDGNGFQPDVGCRLTAQQVAHGILQREAVGERIDTSVLDPGAFQHHDGPSIAENMARAGVAFRPADNTRVSQRGPLSGWNQVRERLVGEEEGGPPMIFFFNTCTHTIRTLPAMQHDQNKPEDMDTKAEDHASDCVRYGCSSRPWMRTLPKPLPPPRGALTIKEMADRFDERENERRRI